MSHVGHPFWEIHLFAGESRRLPELPTIGPSEDANREALVDDALLLPARMQTAEVRVAILPRQKKDLAFLEADSRWRREAGVVYGVPFVHLADGH